MSSIGRLPTPVSAGIGSRIEDDELELLSLQLSTTANVPNPAVDGSFSQANFSTQPRKRHKQKSLILVNGNVY